MGIREVGLKLEREENDNMDYNLLLKIIFTFGTIVYSPVIIKAIVHKGMSASQTQVLIFSVSLTGLIVMFLFV